MDNKKASLNIKKIPLKNYIIFGIMCILVIGLVFYLSIWYQTKEEYYKNNSVMADILPHINKQELVNFTLENPNTIIYAASSKDIEIKEFEKQFRKLVLNNNLTNQIVFLDTSKYYNQNLNEELIKTVKNKKLVNTIDFNEGVSLILFENGKVKLILNRSSNSVKINVIKEFLEINEVLENA